MTWRRFKQHIMRRLINFYGPFLGAGIKVVSTSPDYRDILVRMKMHFWTRNYVGSHFGGSLYAMTDPFYMLMMIENLGPEYIVWDKAALIRFKRPGLGTVTARFTLTQAQLDEVRTVLATQPKYEPVYQVQVVDEQGVVVAEVDKTLHIRKK